MIDQTWDVIIQARNAAATVAAVVISARSALGAGEVIVLDDESTDGTVRAAMQAGATVIKNEVGTSGIANVVAASRAQTFVLFSAAVTGAAPEHFEALANPVVSDQFALVVGLTEGEGALYRRLPSLSPLRAMRRDILEGIPLAKRRLPVEIMTNQVAARRGVHVGVQLLSGCAHASSIERPGMLRSLTSIPLMSLPGWLRRVEILPGTETPNRRDA